MPRLVSIKILDEPVVTPKAMDYCDYCRRVFAERYGGELKPPEKLADDAFGRWKLASFLGDYVADGYKVGLEIKQRSGARWDLLVTYMSTALGFQGPLSYQEDGLDWLRQADRADFDVYPYFYPSSQKLRMLVAAYTMAAMRDYARHLHKPWGFYFELDDRNWPYQKNPKEASTECAYTAVCQGADYLNSFIHEVFATGCSARPERWAVVKQELPRIRRVGPLLLRLPRVRSMLAHFFPDSQQYVNNGYAAPTYAWHCLNEGWGMMDVYHEEVAREAGLGAYKGLLLLGTDLLYADMIPQLDSWIRAGGVLVTDKRLRLNHRGEAVTAPWDREATPRNTLPGFTDLSYATWPHGKGRVIFWDFDADEQYKRLVEGDQPEKAAALRADLARVLEQAGLQAPASVSDPHGQMEVGLRAAQDTALVIVVNHNPEHDTGAVQLRGLGFQPAFACDLRTMKPVSFTPRNRGASLKLTLPGRSAAMIALYPGRPRTAKLTVEPAAARRNSQVVCDLVLSGQKGCHLVELKVTDARGKPIPWLERAVATEAGRASLTLPVALNEPTGRHVVTAVLPQTGIKAQASYMVRD
jgi:hypothetical protein